MNNLTTEAHTLGMVRTKEIGDNIIRSLLKKVTKKQKGMVKFRKIAAYLLTLILGMYIASLCKSKTHEIQQIVQQFTTLHFKGSQHCKNISDGDKERFDDGFTDQLDPGLLEHIRCDWMYPPSVGPLNLETPWESDFSQYGQSTMLDLLMDKKKGGFFVECGAANGEFLSNTLFFERQRSWTGILIEGNPSDFQKLILKQRKAYSINACLNTENKTGRVLFNPTPLLGGLVSAIGRERQKLMKRSKLFKGNFTNIKIQCFTLYSILAALKRTHIDIFSLDVEGAELDILKTIPFAIITIDVLLVEYTVLDSWQLAEKRFKAIYNFFDHLGLYDFVGTYKKVDMLFVLKGRLGKEKLLFWKKKLRLEKRLLKES